MDGKAGMVRGVAQRGSPINVAKRNPANYSPFNIERPINLPKVGIMATVLWKQLICVRFRDIMFLHSFPLNSTCVQFYAIFIPFINVAAIF